jgi:hypothetical protein
VLGIDASLGPEPAADRDGADPDRLLFDSERRRDPPADRERCLAGHHAVQAPVRSGGGQDPVRLDRHRRHPLVDEPCAHHDVGAVEHSGVRRRRLEHHVRAVRGEEQRRARVERGQLVDHRGQRVHVHDHELRRVHRGRPGLCDDDRDGLPHESHPVRGQAGSGQLGAGRAVGTRPLRDVGKREVRRREGGHDAGQRRRPGDVHGAQLPVRDGRAHEDRVEHSVDAEVGEVIGRAGEQGRVLTPLHTVAEDTHAGRLALRHGGDSTEARPSAGDLA